MKVMISYPPLKGNGYPTLGQNRQFQWFNTPTYIYPMVPAYAATLLKQNGYDVIWNDAIAEGWSYQQWLDFIEQEKPDLIVFETKTPVVKQHWKIIDELKTQNPQLKTALMGDHVTALPEESMQNSKVDYVLTGGNYDFLLLNLCQYLNPTTYDLRPTTNLEPGIYYRENDQIKNTGLFKLNHNLDSLPFIDRDLTKWQLYSKKNGNYKNLPGTYTMAARDCWWGRCSFCSWTTLYPGKEFNSRSPEKLLDEIGMLIEKYKVKEIMDDSGTFPVGNWLKEFCLGMIERGYNKKISLNCNMRFGVLSQDEWDLMGKAGFRFILFGLESANQKTLDRVNKNLKVKQISEGVKMAKRAGLEPHITSMIGYPWENKEDAQNTINLAKDLFKNGWVDSLQATIVIPYPGTPLHNECKENDWLLTENWDEYDMQGAVMRTSMNDCDIKEFTQGLYKSFMSPQFIFKKVISVRNMNDVAFLWRAGTKVLSHLVDFKPKTEI